jgi:hypothetical protein
MSITTMQIRYVFYNKKPEVVLKEIAPERQHGWTSQTPNRWAARHPTQWVRSG